MIWSEEIAEALSEIGYTVEHQRDIITDDGKPNPKSDDMSRLVVWAQLPGSKRVLEVLSYWGESADQLHAILHWDAEVRHLEKNQIALTGRPSKPKPFDGLFELCELARGLVEEDKEE